MVPNFLNLKKCIFFPPFQIPLGHVIFRYKIRMDPAKVMIIIDLPPPSIVKKLRSTLGHMSHHQKFIRVYAEVTSPMDKLLKKGVKFQWSEQFQESSDVLKNKMVIAPILVFPNWKKEFHVHVDASPITLGVLLAQLGEGSIDNHILFASIKLSTMEKNYTTTKREGLSMVYTLKTF